MSCTIISFKIITIIYRPVFSSQISKNLDILTVPLFVNRWLRCSKMVVCWHHMHMSYTLQQIVSSSPGFSENSEEGRFMAQLKADLSFLM